MKRTLVMASLLTVTVLGLASRGNAMPPPDLWEAILSEPGQREGKAGSMMHDGRHHKQSGGPMMPGHSGMHDGMKPCTPPKMHSTSCHPAMMARLLDLTEKQKKEIAQVLEEGREQAKPLMVKEKELFTKFLNGERADRFDEGGMRTIAGDLSRIKADLMVSRAKINSRIRAILSPVQRQVLDKLEPAAPGCPMLLPHHPGQHPDMAHPSGKN